MGIQFQKIRYVILLTREERAKSYFDRLGIEVTPVDLKLKPVQAEKSASFEDQGGAHSQVEKLIRRRKKNYPRRSYPPFVMVGWGSGHRTRRSIVRHDVLLKKLFDDTARESLNAR